jgi:hypothetical protein
LSKPSISGFREFPQTVASGAPYTGRLCCDDVQFTGDGADVLATFTITVRQLVDAAESSILWTDQDMQRGIRPEVAYKVDRELSLAKGYPDPKIYVFNTDSADEMTEKLLHGQRLFINPLVWNLRPNTFEAYFDGHSRKVYLYSGRIYLPDSHHRHQAILKAAAIYRQAPTEYPKFDLDKQFKVELYFLKREDEGNYFFDKNQRPTPTAKSKAYDLSSLDDQSILAKRVIDLTPALHKNVNRVTDRLTVNNPNVVTLSTLRESLKAAVETDGLDESEMEGTALVASKFLSILAEIRPEIGLLPISERKKVRHRSLVDAPLMFQGYGALIADFNLDVSKLGMHKAETLWLLKLKNLSNEVSYQEGAWTGDLFLKNNPVWLKLGVIKPGLTGQPTINNNRGARLQVAKVLRAVINRSPDQNHLSEMIK